MAFSRSGPSTAAAVQEILAHPPVLGALVLEEPEDHVAALEKTTLKHQVAHVLAKGGIDEGGRHRGQPDQAPQLESDATGPPYPERVAENE